MVALGLSLATLIGLSLGLLGGGGSILTVPIFVYVLGFAAKPAIAMSLAVVGATSIVGTVAHWRAGNVTLRVAVAFGAVAMVGAYVGARLAAFVSSEVQLAMLAVAMLAAAISLLRQQPSANVGAAAGEVNHGGAQFSLGVIVVVGLGIGLLTGVVGVGGGFLIVPALVVLARVPMKQAIGTSLVVIAMNSASGFLGYLGQVDFPWRFMAIFSAVASAGIVGGTYLVRFVSQRVLKQAFAVVLLLVGVLILYENRAVVFPNADATINRSS